MSTELTNSANNPRLKSRLSRDAISLALKAEWERAAEVNQALLELFETDVDAMNRLGKAYMELGQYAEAREVLDRVGSIAPYNTIAKKNLARVVQLANTPAPSNKNRRAGSAPQFFIEESGKSGTTILQKPATGQVVARIAPSDMANLVVEQDTIKVYTRDDEYLGQIEPKLGRRLTRLMYGGNKYEAAVIGINSQGISIIVREIYRDRSLHNVCSFPTKIKEEHRVYQNENLARYINDDDLDDEDEEGAVIVEDEMDTGWNDNE